MVGADDALCVDFCRVGACDIDCFCWAEDSILALYWIWGIGGLSEMW